MTPTTEPEDDWIERFERPMLVLAVIAVAVYMAELQGVWKTLGVTEAYNIASMLIDTVFALDLLVKLRMRGGRYVGTPWFLVDLLSTLPILTHTQLLPPAMQGLRFVRTFRLFRVLRTLRALRVLRSMTVFDLVQGPASEVELETQRNLERALSAVVLGFAAFFLGIAWFADTTDEQEFWLVLGTVVGMSLMLVIVRFQLPAIAASQVRGLLNIALPHQVAREFLNNPDNYNRTEAAPATVIFCDITGFTTAVEELGADTDRLKKHLEEALEALVEAHIHQDLIVDKFIGDAVMSFRGGPHVDGTEQEHAYRVVRAALDGCRALAAQNNPLFTGVKIGGASSKAALIGTFGTSRRLSYTILGDRVNLAARLEGACNKLGVRTLFCARTRALCGETPDVAWRRVGRVRVSGKDERVEVFEAFDTSEHVDWIPEYETAVALYEVADFDDARKGFERVVAAREDGDGPSKRYIGLCDQFKDGTPEGWEPVLVTRK